MPSIVQLKYILSVDKLKHFGKAAEECHVSQPSLSIQIQKVEEEIGFLLFDRLKKPIVATEKGFHFIEQARRVVVEHEKLIGISAQFDGEISGTFHLGIIPTIMPYLLPLFLKSFSDRYPKVKLIIDELKTQDIIDLLRTDSLDAGILATPLKEKGIRERKLYYEPFMVYANEESPVLKSIEVELDNLSSKDIWLLEDGHCFRNQITQYCSMNRSEMVYPNIVFEGGNLETLRQLVRSSRGYTLVPSLFVDQLSVDERNKNIRRLASPIPTREISLVFQRDQWKTDIIKVLMTCVQECLPESVFEKVGSDHQIMDIDSV
ncbi:MAG: LysR family transcriptional regulator [Pseudobacteriovorax sp.]|nr:LysR family transcriptional regulator [Pseudobacteriovorax sp.]